MSRLLSILSSIIPCLKLKPVISKVTSEKLFGRFETLKPFGTQFSEGILLGPIFSAIISISFAIYLLRFKGNNANIKRISLFRWIVILYLAATAVFAVCRAFTEINRLVLTLAAIHNLLEWGIIWHLVHSQSNFQLMENNASRYFVGTCYFFMWPIILGIVYIPQLVRAFLWEEQFGILCDYLIVFLFYRLNSTNNDFRLKPFYAMGVKASMWHFGQIFPLLFVGYGMFSAVVGSLIISLTMLPFCHYYAQCAVQYETIKNSIDLDATSEKDHHIRGFDGITWKVTLGIFAICIGIAFCSVSGLLLIGGICQDNEGLCAVPSYTGMFHVQAKTGKGDELNEIMKQLITPSREGDGNIMYNLLRHDIDPDIFYFVEEWDTKAHMQEQMTSPHVASVFRNESVTAYIQTMNTIGPFHRIDYVDCHPVPKA